VTMVNNGSYPYLQGPFVRYRTIIEEGLQCMLTDEISGELLISW
jgi:hypothetical protein